MLTQIQCPNCGTPYRAEVHQVIDVGRHPELKAALLSGQLNVAVCPSCGTSGQLASALVYHDPAHELLMIHVPQELNLDQIQREEYVGRLTREVVDNTPQEQRRAYMLQPMTMFTMQSFMEKVLETEGITKEMIARQQKQAELLNTLVRADNDVIDHLLRERAGEIDEIFFAMLRQYIDAASQMNDDKQLIPLINLQAKLMTETEVGRRLERQQIMLHKLNQDAKASGGLTPAVLLKHVLENQEDPAAIDALTQVGMGAMTYEFFSGLTAEIEKQTLAGNDDAAQRLTAIRDDLLQVREEVQTQTRQILDDAGEILDVILDADNMKQSLSEHLDSIDDAFMYVLAARMDRAESQGSTEELEKLNQLRELIVEQIEGQTPPEVQLLNKLVRANSDDERQKLIEENQEMLSPDLITVVDALIEQAESSGQQELADRLNEVGRLLKAEAN